MTVHDDYLASIADLARITAEMVHQQGAKLTAHNIAIRYLSGIVRDQAGDREYGDNLAAFLDAVEQKIIKSGDPAHRTVAVELREVLTPD